ncbi:S-adenosyl-L-methionine-dependent methyltransferase [Hypoxylon cercidicola]|nr:S-adenosyl-L-methionine-dependent methyltransferase [Hypoxylon cercidicola]
MSFSQPEQARKAYNDVAATYSDYGLLPLGQLESQLIQLALGDCTGLSILDLGGGTGLHARQAVNLGASGVDVVDISGEMLRIGEQENDKLLSPESKGKIRFFEADVSKPFGHLGLPEGGYDVVMGNWIFSSADNMEVLEGIFRNIVAYLKPGGRFVGVRDADPWSPAIKEKYGATYKWVKRIPGGIRYLCSIHCTPPIEFECACLEVIYSGSTELHERFGLVDVKAVPYEKARVIQEDPKFWELFLEHPHLVVVHAVKK